MSDDFGDEKKFLDCFWKKKGESQTYIPQYCTCCASNPLLTRKEKAWSRRTESAFLSFFQYIPPLPSPLQLYQTINTRQIRTLPLLPPRYLLHLRPIRLKHQPGPIQLHTPINLPPRRTLPPHLIRIPRRPNKTRPIALHLRYNPRILASR